MSTIARMRYVVDVLYLLAALLYSPVLLYQMIGQGKNRAGWWERFGRVPRFDATRPRIWIHAVSLGEINATPRLAAMLSELLPEYDIVISTTTDTGYARAVGHYGADRVFRFPLDFGWMIRRALDRVRPSMIVLVELEVWFNLLHEARARGIPVVVVNGRLTQRSARRFKALGPAARSMFSSLRWVGAQDEPMATRFRRLGTPQDRIAVTSSLKWDSAEVTDTVENADRLSQDLQIDDARRLLVCGSTGPGEEEMILNALAGRTDRMELVIVPRKPERFDEVARLITGKGFCCTRRSACATYAAERASSQPSRRVILGDTMGELRKFYSLADLVFVGRSLVPMGGSDPMEAAALGKAILMGPHTENFALPVASLVDAGALRIVRNERDLGRAVDELLAAEEVLRRMGAHGRNTVRRHQGATRRTAIALAGILSDEEPGVGPAVLRLEDQRIRPAHADSATHCHDAPR